jgi:NAD(P)-dependent dehydrogenase (short-subunit alcohol dehydrogenase family)
MPPAAQSVSPLAPIGVTAALQAANDPSIKPKPKIFDEFALTDRVGIVSGGNRGLGLEMALALCEAGARAIYCFDLPSTPSDEWQKTQEYVKLMGNGSRLEYVSVDVRDQQALWTKAKEIGDQEQRMDVCIAAAGILKSHTDCLTYPAEQFKEARI